MILISILCSWNLKISHQHWNVTHNNVVCKYHKYLHEHQFQVDEADTSPNMLPGEYHWKIPNLLYYGQDTQEWQFLGSMHYLPFMAPNSL